MPYVPTSTGGALDLAEFSRVVSQTSLQQKARSLGNLGASSVAINDYRALSRGNWPTCAVGTSSHSAISVRIYQQAARATRSIRLVWIATQNTGGAEVATGNVTEVKAAVEIGGVTRPVFFSGRRLALKYPGVALVSDPLSVVINNGDVFYIRMFNNRLLSSSYTSSNGEIGLLTANQTALDAGWQVRTQAGLNPLDTAFATNSTGVDPFATADQVDAAGAMSQTTVYNFYGPHVVGAMMDATRTVVGVGTSIEMGQGDSFQPDHCGGWVEVGASIAGLPSLTAALASARYSTAWTPATGVWARGEIVRSGDIAVMGAPTNDIADGQTFAQVQASMRSVAANLRANGQRVVVGTMLPRPLSSTDFWRQANNQALATFEPVRVAYNAWIRSNPSDFDAFIDVASVCDDGTGRWISSTQLFTGTATSSNTAEIRDTGKTLTPNAFAGMVAHNITTNTTHTVILNNTATVMTLLGGSTTSGDSYEVRQQITYDGIHPSGYGHTVMGQLLATMLPYV